MRRRRIRLLSLAMVLGASLAGLIPGVAGAWSRSEVPTSAAQTFSVRVGAATVDHAVETWQFYPSTMTIDAGDTVVWHFADSVHTVSFGKVPSDINHLLAPAGTASYDGTGFANSGLILAFADLTKPLPTYALTFPKPGTYTYAKVFHPSMSGSVVVQPAGSPYPAGQAAYQAASDLAQVAALKAGAAALAAQAATSKANGDGTTTYAMNAGYGDNQNYGLMRFGASSLAVHVGDTLVWTQNDLNELHTVTFLDQGKDVPFFVNGQLNPVGATPAGGTVYKGTGFFNSGVLMPTKSYSLTFSQPGTYSYVCLIHDDLGMKATLTVLAASSPTALPHTGGVPDAGLILGVAGLLLIGVGMIGSRRARTIEG